jgi:hypothetical protein
VEKEMVTKIIDYKFYIPILWNKFKVN